MEAQKHLFTATQLLTFATPTSLLERDLLKISKAQLRELLARVEAAHEQEKSAFAHTLHDDLSQKLTALLIELSLLESAFGPDTKEAQKLADLSQIVGSVSQSVRRMTNQLRLKILDEFGLFSAIRHEIERWTKETGAHFTLTPESLEIDLDPQISTQLFKSFQKVISDMLEKHDAQEIHVTIKVGPHDVLLSVSGQAKRKDGKKLFHEDPLGLLCLQEQIHRLHGSFKIAQRPGGSSVSIKVPLPKQKT